ncbi:MAG: cyanophycin synthetase [Proteobacteria bacterium]|nr:cyanophycin synthetase [Pseudomonadota bacterium]
MKLLNKMIYKLISRWFMDGCSDYNSLSVRKSSRTKLQARESFAALNIPHAPGRIFLNPIQAVRFVKKHGFPVVIKPNVSGYSRGSHFPINNYKDLWKAAFAVKIWWPTSIIEKYLSGKNYRVVVIKDEIMSVIRRYPPFITGDGHQSIDQLIDQENQVRRSLELHPVIHPVQKNHRTRNHLKKQNLTLSSIPEAGQTIELYNKVALSPGGVVETIDKNSVAPKNRELFLKLLDSFDASIFGIDVIFEKGIEFDFQSQNCIFLELNSRPYLKMHHYPRFGSRQNFDPFYQKLEHLNIADSGGF